MNTFFCKKRNDLTKNASKSKPDTLYKLSFLNTITNYHERMTFKNNLIQNNKLNYQDELILKIYKINPETEYILYRLCIDFNTLLDCYIRNLGYFDNLDEILDTILKKDPTKIGNLLHSSFFQEFFEELTEKEQEIIYLKLVSKYNPSMTNQMISTITNIDIDEIDNYQIMSKSDNLNKLNQYMKIKK